MEKKSRVIVNFGDSIFGNKRPPDDISSFLAQLTGATVYNCGFGGCRMSKHLENWDPFGMYRLADAVVTRDFSLQESVDIAGHDMPQYFVPSLAQLKAIDFHAVDAVTIAYGCNDLTAGKQIDDPSDRYNVDCFAGALRYSIERLLAAYPHLQIYLCSQMWYTWMGDGDALPEDGDGKRFAGGTLPDFVAATRRVAQEYHLPFINLYDELGINRLNRLVYFPANDGFHHNPRGAELIARKIAKALF